MNFLQKFFSVILTVFFTFTSIYVFGQEATVPAGVISETTYTSLSEFIKGIEWVYGFLVIVTGYLSSFIPGLNKIDKAVYRVLALAFVIGAAFYFGGQASLFNLVVTYTISTSFYETILKLFVKSPKNKEVTATS
jgi:hypothetical protein